MTSTTTDPAPNQRAAPGGHRAGVDIGAVLSRGAAAGLAGGLMFALANMWFSEAHGKPLVAPFLAISTIFHGSTMPVMSQPDVIAGLVLHLGLSLVFGMVFALGVVLLRLGSRPALLVAAAIVYGLVLYVVDFQIIGRIAFSWFVNPEGPNQLFELWIHPVTFGLVLVPFFLGFRAPSRP